jgi:hypothetical protein
MMLVQQTDAILTLFLYKKQHRRHLQQFRQANYDGSAADSEDTDDMQRDQHHHMMVVKQVLQAARIHIGACNSILQNSSIGAKDFLSVHFILQARPHRQENIAGNAVADPLHQPSQLSFVETLNLQIRQLRYQQRLSLYLHLLVSSISWN